jgi:hypothetical protein
VIRDIFDSLENVLYIDFGSCKDRCAKRDGYVNSEKIDGLKESQHKIFILEEYESLVKDYDSDELVVNLPIQTKLMTRDQREKDTLHERKET